MQRKEKEKGGQAPASRSGSRTDEELMSLRKRYMKTYANQNILTNQNVRNTLDRVNRITVTWIQQCTKRILTILPIKLKISLWRGHCPDLSFENTTCLFNFRDKIAWRMETLTVWYKTPLRTIANWISKAPTRHMGGAVELLTAAIGFVITPICGNFTFTAF